jgi:hypothetical protein
MSSQAHSGPRDDGAKKRQEYVVQKAACNMAGISLAIYALAVGAFALILIRAAIQSIGVSVSNTIFFTILSVAVLAFGLNTGRQSVSSFKESQALTYVPSVSEQLQIAALSADEVLLRGSEQPVATPEELLRAAQQGTETASEELLRPESRSV